MPSSRCSFVLLSIALCLSIQQRESFAFGWTQNLSRKVRKNPSRFQVASVTSTNLNKMRQRPGLEVIRIGASSSSSASIDDGDADNVTQQSPSNWWLKDPRNRSVSGILISSFLSLLGFTMVAGPLTPALGKHFNLQVGSLFGALTSAYPLGMMIGIFIWPSLSDRVGRRKILSFSLFGSGLGLVAQALVIQRGGSLFQFLLARSLTGLFAGSSPVSKAYLADIGAKDGKLPRYLSLKDASSTLAFIMGPAAGGLLFDIRRKMIGVSEELTKVEVLDSSGSLSFVISITAAASMLASLVAALLVQESSVFKNRGKEGSPKDKADGIDLANAKPEDDDEEELISCPLGRSLWAGVASVCLVSFCFNVGDSTFHAFFSTFLRNRGIVTKDIGLLFTSLASISFLVSSTCTSRILRSIGPVLTCAGGLTLVGSSLLFMGLAASPSVLIQPSFAALAGIASLYFCGVSLYGPTIPTMLLRCVPPKKRGFILGLDGFINTLARILTPIISGEIYRRYNAGTAFTTAGIAVVCGVITTLLRRFITTRGSTKAQ
mmetsp:Transcript_12981/g.32766  ORF Transcript_12981/g.32766 Transcript_12981/m.32766 type:complete len:547 (+) Transcript_12981:290-1930(+)